MRQGLATELEPQHRHHGSTVVNMGLDADDVDKGKHDGDSYQMDREEVEDLFKKLDKNNDGRIDVNELAEGLKHLHGSRYKVGQAQVCMKHSNDITARLKLPFSFITPFVACILSHE